MDKIISKITICLLWIGLLVLPGCRLGCGGSSSGPAVTPYKANFSVVGKPSVNSIYLSEIGSERGSLTLGINANKLEDINAVYFDLVYDSAVINYSASEEGVFFNSDGQSTSGFQVSLENKIDGRLYASINRLNNAAVKGSGLIGKMTFTPVSADTTLISFENNKLVRYNSSTMETIEITTGWFGGLIVSKRI